MGGSPTSPCMAPEGCRMLPLEGGGIAFPITSTAGEQLLPQGTLLALSGISGAASRGSLQAQTLPFCRLS